MDEIYFVEETNTNEEYQRASFPVLNLNGTKDID